MAIDADTSYSRKKKKKLEKYIVRRLLESSRHSELLTYVSGEEAETGGASWHSSETLVRSLVSPHLFA